MSSPLRLIIDTSGNGGGQDLAWRPTSRFEYGYIRTGSSIEQR